MPPSLNLTGAPNFRDLGGYRTESGRVVAHLRLLRSDHLANLSPADLSLLSAHLGKSVRVLDLRGAVERAAAACVVPGANVHSLPIEPTIVQVLADIVAAGQRPTAADAVAHMQETYRGFVRHNTNRFVDFFRHLLESNQPTVFHCTAGKDRTGFAAALVLRSLGASDEDVMRDYLLTNERLRPPEVSRHAMAPEVVSVLSRVQPEFLHAAFEAVDQGYGGLEAYFREGLGLREAERERLRELYLEAGDA